MQSAAEKNGVAVDRHEDIAAGRIGIELCQKRMVGETARQQELFRRSRTPRLMLDNVPNAAGKGHTASPIEPEKGALAPIEIEPRDRAGQHRIGYG